MAADEGMVVETPVIAGLEPVDAEAQARILKKRERYRLKARRHAARKRAAKEAEERRLADEAARQAAEKTMGDPEGDGTKPPLYRAMCLVLSRPKHLDRTGWEHQARQWLEDNRAAFMKYVAEMQAEELKRGVPVSVVGEVQGTVDVEVEKVLETAERLLKEATDA